MSVQQGYALEEVYLPPEPAKPPSINLLGLGWPKLDKDPSYDSFYNTAGINPYNPSSVFGPSQPRHSIFDEQLGPLRPLSAENTPAGTTFAEPIETEYQADPVRDFVAGDPSISGLQPFSDAPQSKAGLLLLAAAAVGAFYYYKKTRKNKKGKKGKK